MIRLIRDLRIVPIALAAVMGLFVLKTFGIMLAGGYTLGRMPQDATSPDSAPRSWAQEMFNFPSRSGPARDEQPRPAATTARSRADASDITGSVPAPKAAPPAAKDAAKAAPAEPPPDERGVVALPESGRVLSTAERALLERLQERRNELDEREREIEMRENLLKAAEKKLEERSMELKTLEQRINETIAKKDEAEAARFKGLVAMYENMKAKDAAKIFDRLDLRVLLDVASQINPRVMSDILGQMTPEAAEKLTVELANRFNSADKKAAMPVTDAAALPKIEGRPTAPAPGGSAAAATPN